MRNRLGQHFSKYKQIFTDIHWLYYLNGIILQIGVMLLLFGIGENKWILSAIGVTLLVATITINFFLPF
ncbi:hypothetical protein FACS1894166_11520 [Bacilli bacterium]|nr:hypothetical protein FACS1894166_11520 [Bacilli bacterium]